LELFHLGDGHYSRAGCPPGQALVQEVVMKKLVALFLLSVFSVLAGCNTMEGMGRDIERGGEKIQDKSR
jgi:predicted small secreted protein